jgi:hypothetical protein
MSPTVVTGTNYPKPGAPKPVIGLRTALLSTIRTWFVYRDEALWAFVGGTEADRPLELIEIDESVTMNAGLANEACKRAWDMAERIARQNEQKAATVMREAIAEVLSAESPSFLLAVAHIPGSF